MIVLIDRLLLRSGIRDLLARCGYSSIRCACSITWCTSSVPIRARTSAALRGRGRPVWCAGGHRPSLRALCGACQRTVRASSARHLHYSGLGSPNCRPARCGCSTSTCRRPCPWLVGTQGHTGREPTPCRSADLDDLTPTATARALAQGEHRFTSFAERDAWLLRSPVHVLASWRGLESPLLN